MNSKKTLVSVMIIAAALIFAAVSAEAEKIYTYYPNGRLQSVTLTPPDGPDQYGNVYYYYQNEDWKGQGYGRVSKIIRQAPLNGELSYTLTYYSDKLGYLYVKKAYSDSNWRILAVAYTYYNYASSNLESKMLESPDSSGNIKYEYINEDFQGRGYGRLSKIVRADGSYELFVDYWPGAETVRVKETYSAGGLFLERIEDLGGGLYRRMVNEAAGYHVYTYDSRGTIAENDPVWGMKLFFYDDNGIFTSYARMYTTPDNVRIKEEYDSRYRLVSKYEMDRPFFSGVNLPWLDYGKDIGIARFDNIAHGFSTKVSELDARMRELAGSVTRVFLLNDLRSGITLDALGDIIGFDDQAVRDLKALLDASEANGVKVILTLFDYLLADGISSATYWNGFEYVTEPLGEYPQFITDAAKRAQLVSAVRDLFTRAGLNDYRSVVGFDIMNEPEWAHDWGGVSYDDLRSFVYDFRDMLHADFAGRFVTLGSKDRSALTANWGSGLDLYQFHHYDWMSYYGMPLDYPDSGLGLDRAIFAGELEPTLFTYKLGTLYENGYAGGLFWQDTGYYNISNGNLKTLLNWFVGTTYEYYSSGMLKSKSLSFADVYGNIRYEYIDENYLGRTYARLSRIVKADYLYEIFVEYWGQTEQVKTKELYDASGILVGRYNYDQYGNYIPRPYGVDAGYFVSRQAAVDIFVQGVSYNVHGQPAGYGESGDIGK
ncbi:MAG: hypothetical protein Q8N91_03555 [Candidatus Omnitrophota bacterium]|nr:hypothetical protein [Candidatus Omnitrophota bacterium]